MTTPTLDTQFDLTDDQREVRAMVREFAERRIVPHAAQWDRDHHFERGSRFGWVATGTAPQSESGAHAKCDGNLAIDAGEAGCWWVRQRQHL